MHMHSLFVVEDSSERFVAAFLTEGSAIERAALHNYDDPRDPWSAALYRAAPEALLCLAKLGVLDE
jgi:hypothetical protein